jgi:hypothetical protein
LAQLAEESAQYAASAAAFCSNSTDVHQVTEVANAAEQAAQRAAWAAKVMSEYEPPEGTLSVEDGDTWVATIKQITQQAHEAASQAVQNCRASARLAIKKQPLDRNERDGDKRSRVPCKFFETGTCLKGEECQLSHDPRDKTPRLLMNKRAEECRFFAQGNCIRGAACTFAHGAEELATIQSIQEEEIERSKKFKHDGKPLMHHYSRPGDWECPGCGDLQFARNTHCRKCGRARRYDN